MYNTTVQGCGVTGEVSSVGKTPAAGGGMTPVKTWKKKRREVFGS